MPAVVSAWGLALGAVGTLTPMVRIACKEAVRHGAELRYAAETMLACGLLCSVAVTAAASSRDAAAALKVAGAATLACVCTGGALYLLGLAG